MKIGITGPDLILSHGGAQNHTLNVIRILSNYFEFIYFPDPYFYDKYRHYRNAVKERVKTMTLEGLKLPSSFDAILDENYSYNEIIKIYSEEQFDYIFDFDFNSRSIIPYDFITVFSKIKNVKFGVALQGLADISLRLPKFFFDTIRLDGGFKIPLFRAYQYFMRKVMIYKLTHAENNNIIMIMNKNYWENIRLEDHNVRILFPSNGWLNNITSDGNLTNLDNILMKKQEKIIYFARLSYGKGLFDIPKILLAISDKRKIKLTVVGKFEYEDERIRFFRMLEKYGLSDLVDYRGFLGDKELYEEILSSKVMLYPSHSDSFSIAILQALSLRTPVVAYNIAGLRIYSGLSAVKLVDEFDYDAMADAVIDFISKGNYDDLFSDANLKEFLRLHTWENVAEQYKDVFARIAEDLKIK
ncbi:hypothetical protein DMB44_03710 [Thermoplasma sp. Kam2015]|uniref:glycosyltransferase family 4 protein n=1 Tax=Thermoplasma sp. Kam2015 TaxID=2094122 RepID=UPI000D84AD5C|nr:glycosyltransferase [Thermoplasma sp. Kam2015]PYB68457.1 hypothetical protein DMB44_03710 [Thermoplasma sp. Kam2015]